MSASTRVSGCSVCGAPARKTLVLGFSCEHERCPIGRTAPSGPVTPCPKCSTWLCECERDPGSYPRRYELHCPKCDDLVPRAWLNSSAPDLLAAAIAARGVLDALMGDTDLDGDDSAEFRAMQMLSAAIDKAMGGKG